MPLDKKRSANDVTAAAEADVTDSNKQAKMTTPAPVAVVITEPTDKHILCGRGGLVNKHAANIVYRMVVEKNKDLYRQVPKIHRMLVSQSIVTSLKNEGYQFLGNGATTQTWIPIEDRKAVGKTSQALREKPVAVEAEEESADDDVVAQVAHAAEEIIDEVV